jgi:RNA polymerase sigma factor for flagellar operon FliA
MLVIERTPVQRLPEADALALWQDWRAKGDRKARERLIEHYLPFARIMAGKLYRHRHCLEHEYDDYLQLATIGMIESLDRYDPEGDASFTTFAAKRVRGAILDGVGKLSERQQRIDARDQLLAERTASLGGGKQIGANAFDRLADIAIGLALGHILDESGYQDVMFDTQPDNRYNSLEMRQLRENLLALVEQLPERERLVIKYNYFNHVKFDLLAEQWGVTRGRIAQLHRSALEKLRTSASELRHYENSY